MLFNSLAYALFLPLVVAAYYLLPGKWRWLWLILASAGFYMWFIPTYFLILAGVILIDYFAAFGIARSEGGRRRIWLTVSLIANVGILAVFKYYDFLAANVHDSLAAFGINTPLLKFGWELPIGLSFHTFQAMSYTIEVYRRKQEPERHLGVYAVYVLYFPQLVAGPIERPQNLLHQFHTTQRFDWAKTVSGLRLIGLGLFKKVCIADRLSEFVDPLYAAPSTYAGPLMALATVAFAIQIYCDFSGYSDIAIGSARLLGHDLMVNFNRPYLATNIQDFWRRWHISLSTWFRDYLYIPLGGNRVSFFKQCRNVLLVFGISGLWHGADWAYIIWGLIHGALIVGYMVWRKKFPTPRKSILSTIFSSLLTFTLVCLAWVFFRAGTLEKSLEVFHAMGQGWHLTFKAALLKKQLALSGMRVDMVPILLAVVALGFAIDRALEKRSLDEWMQKFNSPLRLTIYASLLLLLTLIGSDGTESFIYFQF